jgi:hypothetical protein
VPDCCPAVPGSNLASPQPTADCQSPGGLPPGMALGCGLTSVRGNRGENYENEPLVYQKNIKKKKEKNLYFSENFPNTFVKFFCYGIFLTFLQAIFTGSEITYVRKKTKKNLREIMLR